MKKSLGLAVLASLALAVPVEAQQAPGDCDVPFTPVLTRQNTGIGMAEFAVIDNVTDWCTFWDRLFSNTLPPPACNTGLVDFNTQVAVVAAIGFRPNGCYSAKITCITSAGGGDDDDDDGEDDDDGAGNNIRVTVSEIVPGPGCICTQATVNPVTIVAVDRPVGTATFESQISTLNCGPTPKPGK